MANDYILLELYRKIPSKNSKIMVLDTGLFLGRTEKKEVTTDIGPDSFSSNKKTLIVMHCFSHGIQACQRDCLKISFQNSLAKFYSGIGIIVI